MGAKGNLNWEKFQMTNAKFQIKVKISMIEATATCHRQAGEAEASAECHRQAGEAECRAKGIKNLVFEIYLKFGIRKLDIHAKGVLCTASKIVSAISCGLTPTKLASY